MRKRKPEIIIAVLLVLLLLTVILTSCSLTGTEGDPYSAGQKARTEFDQATEKRAISLPGSAAQPRCRSLCSGWSSCCGEPRRTDDAAALPLREGSLMDKRSPRSRRETLFILAAGVVGALLAALVMTWYLNRDNRWFRLVSPPGETPAQIVALDRKLSPYVRTQQGNLYLCSGHTWRDACHTVTAGIAAHRAASAVEYVRTGAAPATCRAGGHRRCNRGRALLRGLHLQQSRHPGRRQPVAVAPDLLLGEPVRMGDGHSFRAAAGSRGRVLSRQAEPGFAGPVGSLPGDLSLVLFRFYSSPEQAGAKSSPQRHQDSKVHKEISYLGELRGLVSLW